LGGLDGNCLTDYVTVARDLAGKALNRPRHLVYLATMARSEEMPLERDAAKPEDDDAYRERSECLARWIATKDNASAYRGTWLEDSLECLEK